MKNVTLLRAVAVGALAATILTVSGSAASADVTQTTAGEVADALSKTQGVAPTGHHRDLIVSVPSDLKHGVAVKSKKDGRELRVTPTNTANAKRGTTTKRGMAYPSKDYSANAVIPTSDGVQFITVIDGQKAPTSYSYKINGGVQLRGDGGAIITDAKGLPTSVVAPAWAKDAKGKPVKTHYKTDGKTLTQVVDHRAKGISYPVVADPHVRWYWNGAVITLTRAEMATVAYGGVNALVPLLMIPGVGWGMIVGVVGMAGSAAWAYGNRQCFWFWVQTVWPFVPSTGYYAC